MKKTVQASHADKKGQTRSVGKSPCVIGAEQPSQDLHRTVARVVDQQRSLIQTSDQRASRLSIAGKIVAKYLFATERRRQQRFKLLTGSLKIIAVVSVRHQQGVARRACRSLLIINN